MDSLSERALAARQTGSIRCKFYGVGGAFKVQPVVFNSAEIASIDFTGFLGFRIDSPKVYRDFDGAIGTEFLRFFTAYLEYGYSHVSLERNRIAPDR